MVDENINGVLSQSGQIRARLGLAPTQIDGRLSSAGGMNAQLQQSREFVVPTNFNDLGDVEITNPQEGQVPKYNANTQKWENGDIPDNASWGHISGTLSDQTDLNNALNAKADLVGGKVPASELPSYVDDVIEGYYNEVDGKFYEESTFEHEITPERGKIYVDLANDKTYRWSGSIYVEIGGNLENAYQTTDAAETDIADGDYFPFYDSSASLKKKSLWSNIKAKLKTYFDTIYQVILTMRPTPAANVTEAQVKAAINSALPTNNEIASLFGIQRWSNMKTFRAVLDGSGGGIGHYGVGEWQWILDDPSAADEAGWGWWQNDIFKYLGDTTLNGYDVDFKIKYVPYNGETILLGGYQVDKETGYLCIKFANYVNDIVNAKVVVDVIFTRNDIIYV